LTHASDTQSKLRSTDTSVTVLQQGLYHLLIRVTISGNFC